jgi:importin subunit beta-1
MQTFTPMLVHGLKSFSIESLVTVSVGVVVDLATAIGSAFHPFADAIMTVLMECLRDTSVYRDVKPVVFSSLGDIAMAISAGFEPYLQMSLMLLMQAAQQQVPPDDPEILEFINSLRVSVLEAYSGIMIGLSEGGRSQSFLGALTAVWQFLSFLANDSLKDEIVLQKAVTLLGDLANEMPEQVKPIIQQPFVVQLVSAAQASSNDETREYANWAKEKLELVMRS